MRFGVLGNVERVKSKCSLEHLETPEKQGRFIKERGGASHRLGRWRL